MSDTQKIKNFIVIGLGITGGSVINFLYKQRLAQQLNYKIIAIDTRCNLPNIYELNSKYPEVEFFTGNELSHYMEIINSAACIVVSPGIDLDNPAIISARKNNIEIIGDIELFARYVDAPVIAITGSNGKSTVTTLLGLMANDAGVKVGVGGNIGTPALDLLEQGFDLYILELSSFQLELVNSLQCLAGVILNISPDHLDRHKTFDNYKNAKMKIYKMAEYKIYNKDDLNTYPINIEQNKNIKNSEFSNNQKNILNENKRIIGFSVEQSSVECSFSYKINNSKQYIYYKDQPLINLQEVKLIGTHNIANIIAALTLAQKAKIPLASSVESIKKFSGIEHRCEIILKHKDVIWINDSKGTNVGATKSAIFGIKDSISGQLILILGGQSKGADFYELVEPICNYVKAVILIGEAADTLEKLLYGKVDIHKAKDLKEVVSQALQLSGAGDAVLLSPACASFDMFLNFEDRGNKFKQAVKDGIGLASS